jgi:murein L,D-transpeptidase YcbB/YkuD
LPSTRIVVKDPFAMLSVPCISSVTGAQGVQLYRHPGAVLTSYRRMGWRADLDEMAPFADVVSAAGPLVAELFARRPEDLDDTDAMGVFWSILTTIALDGMQREPRTVMVAHHEIAAGGQPAAGKLFAALGLDFSIDAIEELSRSGSTSGDQTTLHRFDRNPAEVADAWKKKVSPEDVARIELITAPVRSRVEAARLRLLD